MICKTCGKDFAPADSLVGDLGECQACWEAYCDKTWWEMAKSLATAAETAERDAFYGNTYTTAAPEEGPPLTLESLYKTFEALMPDAPIMPRPWGYGWGNPTLATFNGLPLFTSPYLGKVITPEPPVMPKGPYYRRRIKRWRRAHPGYTVGDGRYYLVGNEAIVCHPDDVAKLNQAIAACPPGGQEG